MQREPLRPSPHVSQHEQGNSSLFGADVADPLGLWAQPFASDSATIELPYDYPRPLAPTGERARLPVSLATEALDALAALAAEAGLTPAGALLALFTALLARYSGEEELVVGVTACAPLLSAANPAPARPALLAADLAGGPSLRTLLARQAAALRSAVAQPPTTPEPAASGAGQEPRARCQLLFALAPAAPLPVEAELALVVAEWPGLAAELEYAAELFDPETAAAMAGHLAALLAAAVAAPDQPLDTLPILDAAEHAQLAAWNQSAADLPIAPLHQLVAAHAERTPAAPALLWDGGSMSYAELDARANQLAHHLQALGVGAETIVGVSMGRGSQLIVALLGILKAGGAYLPLDPVYPAARLAAMVADAAPLALICDGGPPAGLLPADGPAPLLVDLSRDAAAIAARPTSRPPERAALSSLAYVIYTSGSTGAPKGVLLQHDTAANYVLGAGMLYGIGPADRGMHFASISFDASVDDIFVPLAHGAGLVVTSGYGPPDFAAFLDLLTRHQITLVSLPTAYWQAWIGALQDARAALPPALRLVIIGGEAASGERYNLWRRLAPPTVRVFNGYGPTETSVGSTWYVPSPHQDEPAGPMAIGRPMPNEQAYVLDRHMRPVPVGVLGELYIGGAGLARGYHKRPELTAERFVPDPFASSFGHGDTGTRGHGEADVAGGSPHPAVPPSPRPFGPRLYRTGDLVRWRRDGQLQYHGRADQQVKVRGYRIEPGEIEAVMRSFPAVHEAAVVARPDQRGELALVGYVVFHGAQADLDALRAFLAERLPGYMLPSALVPLGALPLTPSGKLDRRALPAPPALAAAAPAAADAARTPVEATLAAIWQELLGRPVGIHDNFFDLGGQSLLAMRMLVQVEAALGAKLPVSTLINHGTVAELARLVAGGDGVGSPWSVLVPIQPQGERPPLFCIHGLTGDVLWFHELGRRLAPDQPFYGLQARSLDERQRHYRTIEEMAAHYVAEVRGVQPEGPYYLCGASFGGIIGYEMARQLRAQGQAIGLLAVLDYDPYAAPGGPLENLLRLPSWVANDLLPLSAEERNQRLLRRVRVGCKRLLARLLRAPLPVDAADLLHYGGSMPLHRRELLLANDVAAERYVPQPYDGPLTLFSTGSRYSAAERTGWARLARGGVEVIVVPGSHESMFHGKNVGVLAGHLRALVARALG